MCAKVSLNEIDRSDIYPARYSPDNAAENIRDVVVATIGEDVFEQTVTTALFEILLIQTNTEGQAYTLYYDNEGKPEEEIKGITTKYFDTIDRVFKVDPERAALLSDLIVDNSKVPSLSVLDELYFGEKIWMGDRYKETDEEAPELEGKIWYDIKSDKTLRKNYKERGRGTEVTTEQLKVYKQLFKEYGDKLFEELFKPSQSGSYFFYILLIPVALFNNNPDEREKIGAVFLHIGATKKILREKLLDVYQKVILYWHYHLTGEVLEKRRREEERSSGRAMLYDSIKGPVDELTALLNEAQKPLSDLTSVMSPMKQFIFSGPFLVPFFNSGEATLGDFGYKDPSLIAKQVITTHEVSSDVEIYKNLIPAILLKALGETENACDPLWDYLCFFLKVPRQKKSLADGIIKTLPVLKKDWETAKKKPEDLKKAFKYTKEWFNSSFKDGAELPYSLLGLTANILGIAINKRHTLKEYTFTVVSRPIDTIAAINSIHLEYEGIKNLILKKAGDQAILELELKKEHKMKPKDAKELYKSTCLALKDTYLPRGSTTSILYQLFSSSQIRNESDVTKIFAWDEDTTFTYKEGDNGKTVFSLKFTSNNKIIINTSITRRDHAPD